jgi:acyl-CoA synthetase (AMP-forming)/AMP-acid ligase II
MNVTDAITHHARTRPDTVAIVQGDDSLSYRALDELIGSIAAQLLAHGAQAGEPIGVCLPDRPVHLAAIAAVLRIGAILLPMDWRWTISEQLKIVRKFAPTFVVIDAARPRPDGVRCVVIDETQRRLHREASETDHADRPAVLGLSSGTTGEPKAVVTTHAQYAARIAGFVNACRFRPDDRYASTLPLVFSAGRMFALANLTLGATVILSRSMSSAGELATMLIDSGGTTTCLVPTVSRAMLGLPIEARPMFPDLRVLVSIGAPLSAEDRVAIRRTLSPNLVDVYASTGGSLATAIWPEEQDQFPESVGRPAEHVRVEIVDENDQPITGSIGRVRYQGPGMPNGFYTPVARGDEDLRDGWFYPGDYGSMNEQGYLFLRGRRSEIVIRGGINVFTPEVERAIAMHPAVIEIAVVGVASRDAGEDLVAFIRSSATIDARELIHHCRQHLAAYKIPSRFHFVGSLPKTSSGKVLKRELVEPAD